MKWMCLSIALTILAVTAPAIAQNSPNLAMSYDELLRDESVEVRAAVVKRLLSQGPEVMTPTMMAPLLQIAMDSRYKVAERSAALQILVWVTGESPQPEIVASTIRLASVAESPEVRATALWALGRWSHVRDPHISGVLLGALKGDGYLERRAAIVALSQLPDVLEVVEASVSNAPEREVVAMGLALALRGKDAVNSTVVTRLRELLDRPWGESSWPVIQALTVLSPSDAESAAIRCLRTQIIERPQCIRALAFIGANAGVELVLDAFEQTPGSTFFATSQYFSRKQPGSMDWRAAALFAEELGRAERGMVAAEALARLGAPGHAALVRATQTGKSQERINAVLGLSMIDGRPATISIVTIRDILSDPTIDARMRAAAAESLVGLPGANHLKSLLAEAVQADNSAEFVVSAVGSLSALGACDTVASLWDSPDDRIRAASLRVFPACRSDKAMLIERLLNGSAHSPEAIGEAVSQIPDLRPADILPYLETGSERGRIAAYYALASLGRPSQTLVDATDDSNWLIRRVAVEGLGRARPSPAVTEALYRATYDEVSGVRSAALVALEASSVPLTKKLENRLVVVLKENSEQAPYAADLLGLHERGEVDLVETMSNHPSMTCRLRAAEALGKFSRLGPATLTRLVERMQHDPSPWVRRAAAQAAEAKGDTEHVRRAAPLLEVTPWKVLDVDRKLDRFDERFSGP